MNETDQPCRCSNVRTIATHTAADGTLYVRCEQCERHVEPTAVPS